MTRDMTLFQDDLGEAFLLTASEKNQIMQLSELSGEHLSASGYWKRIFIGENLEAPTILRHDGECYSIGSHYTGWRQILHMQPLPTRSRVLGSCWATLGGVECNLRRRPTWGDASDIRFDGDSCYGGNVDLPADPTAVVDPNAHPAKFDWKEPAFSPAESGKFSTYLAQHRKWMLELLVRQFVEPPQLGTPQPISGKTSTAECESCSDGGGQGAIAGEVNSAAIGANHFVEIS